MASKKGNNILLYAFVVVVVAIALLFTFSTPKGAEIFSKLGVGQEPLSGAAIQKCNPVPRSPILIIDDSGFTAANGVVSGTGSPADPLVISGWKIDDLSKGYGIFINNEKGLITKSFKIDCVTSAFNNVPPTGASLVKFKSVITGISVSNVLGNSGEDVPATGVLLQSSTGVTLDSLSFNKGGDNGVTLDGSDHVSIFRSKLKALHDGLLIKDSHDITVGTDCNLKSGSGDCNEFTYDDGNGIEISNSHDIKIKGLKGTADDSGAINIHGPGTYNVEISGSDINGNGPICTAGVPTGDQVDNIAGLAVTDGAHDITVTGNTIHGNSPIDIKNGGDGKYTNPCTGQTVTVTQSPPGGANLNFNGNCYGTQFGFTPTPTVSCPKS